MPGETGPTLDDEGIPDLLGPLPEKELTGDPQEGLAPPGDYAHAEKDWGITGDEERAGEPLDVRVRHERPDLGDTDPVDEVARDLGLDEPSVEDVDPVEDRLAEVEASSLVGQELIGDDLLDDEEAEEVASAVQTDPLEAQSAEEAAVYVIEDRDL